MRQALAVGFAEKTGLNNKDFFSVVKAPKNMQYVTETLEKMERGDLKVRVRALEAEQRLQVSSCACCPCRMSRVNATEGRVQVSCCVLFVSRVRATEGQDRGG